MVPAFQGGAWDQGAITTCPRSPIRARGGPGNPVTQSSDQGRLPHTQGLCSLRDPSPGVPSPDHIWPSHLALHGTLQRLPELCTMLPRAGGQGEALNMSPGNHIIIFLPAVTLQSYEVGRLGNTAPLYRSKTRAPRGGRADTKALESSGARFQAHTFWFSISTVSIH